jgi:hypothetical protein
LLHRRQDLFCLAQAFYNYGQDMSQFPRLLFLRRPEHATQRRVKLKEPIIKGHCRRFEDGRDQFKAILYKFNFDGWSWLKSPSTVTGGKRRRKRSRACPLSRDCPMASTASFLKSCGKNGAIILPGPTCARNASIASVLCRKFSLIETIAIRSAGDLRRRDRLELRSSRISVVHHRHRSEAQSNYPD